MTMTNGNKSTNSSPRKRLVLVGGGHAHAQVIRALNKASRPDHLDVTLVDVQESASYSGMVPGCIAGTYTPEDTLLHLKPLAKWAGIDFCHDRVIDIDFDRNLIHLDNLHDPIPFDCVSLDIGSKSRGLDECPGAKKYTIPTRPIADLVHRLNQESELLIEKPHDVHAVVIGGGVAGIELSMNVMTRFQKSVGANNRVYVTVLDSGSEFMPSETSLNRQALWKSLKERGIEVKFDASVEQVKEHSVVLSTGAEVPFTHCIWATGAGSHDLAWRLQKRGVSVSEHGWIKVDKNLHSISQDRLFAAGDCCTIEGLPNGSPPKAGVYAVRSGPVLIENLVRYLEEKPLKEYTPQDDFLKLMVRGDGTAIGFRFGIPIAGKWVMKLKDTIDKSFMDLFREENLPELKPGEPYDTSQYDAVKDERPPKKNPSDGAFLLQRTDDDVNYEEAWNVIRDMADDKKYEAAVVEHINNAAPELAMEMEYA